VVGFNFVKADPTGYARVPILVRMHHMKTQFSWASPTGTHGEYADEQLANLQKRIWLIEFLRLGLIIGWQGAMLGLPKFKNRVLYPIFLCFLYFHEFVSWWLKPIPVLPIYELFIS
jgi:hypothetical protein